MTTAVIINHIDSFNDVGGPVALAAGDVGVEIVVNLVLIGDGLVDVDLPVERTFYRYLIPCAEKA